MGRLQGSSPRPRLAEIAKAAAPDWRQHRRRHGDNRVGRGGRKPDDHHFRSGDDSIDCAADRDRTTRGIPDLAAWGRRRWTGRLGRPLPLEATSRPGQVRRAQQRGLEPCDSLHTGRKNSRRGVPGRQHIESCEDRQLALPDIPEGRIISLSIVSPRGPRVAAAILGQWRHVSSAKFSRTRRFSCGVDISQRSLMPSPSHRAICWWSPCAI